MVFGTRVLKYWVLGPSGRYRQTTELRYRYGHRYTRGLQSLDVNIDAGTNIHTDLNIRILHSGSKAYDKEIPETMRFGRIFVFMWSFDPH